MVIEFLLHKFMLLTNLKAETMEIKTKKQYHAALERFEEIFLAKPGTKESDEADVMALLISNYEEQHFVIDAPNDY